MDYGWKGGGVTVIRDYLTEPVEMNGVGIVTNPPFRLAEAFIRKAIADGSVSRLALWREHPPNRIWVSSRRLPMMHHHGWNGPKSTSNVAYMWAVFDARDADRCKLIGLIGGTMTLQLEQNPNLTKPTLSLGSLRTAYEAPIVERADIRQSRRAVKPIKRENLPRFFVHIDDAVADVWPAEDQSADAIRARVRRWTAIVCAEVRRLYPAGSPDRKAAETFAFQHRLSIANCFYVSLS